MKCIRYRKRVSFQSETGEEQNDAEGRGQQRKEKVYAHGGEEVCICHCLRSLALRKASETRKPSISNDEDLGRERTGVFIFSSCVIKSFQPVEVGSVNIV